MNQDAPGLTLLEDIQKHASRVQIQILDLCCTN